MKMNRKKKGILTSVLTIALCLSLIAGSTFALFTSESKVNVAVSAGTVSVTATPSDFATYSAKWNGSAYESVATDDLTFANGGKALVEGNEITLEKMTPGDKLTFTITVENKSNVATSYRTIVDATRDTGLLSGLTVTVAQKAFSGFALTDWAEAAEGAKETVEVSVELPVDAGNAYQNTSVTLSYLVEAVQANGVAAQTPDYVVDENGNVTLYTAYGLKWFASDVNGGNSYEGKTVTLAADVDLGGSALTAIGTAAAEFKGTFVGAVDVASRVMDAESATGGATRNAVISSFTVSGKEGVGLFGFVTGTIKNVTVDNATVTGTHWVGGIVGYIYGTVTGCEVKNSTVTARVEGENGSYDNGDKAGGIAGYAACFVLDNNAVSNTTVSAFRDLGGIVGTAATDGKNDASASGNKVDVVTLTFIDAEKAYDGKVNENAAAVVGRSSDKSFAMEGNEVLEVVILDEEGNVVDMTVEKPIEIEVNGEKVEAVLTNQVEAIRETMTAGGNVVLAGDITVDQSVSGSYGKAGILIVEGGLLDGNGHAVGNPDATGTWDVTVQTNGGTIQNVAVNQGFRGIFICDNKEKVVLNDVVIEGTTYTISCDQGANGGLEANGCTFNGWTSYAATIGEVTFNSCRFGYGNGYAYCRPYANTTFNGCTFGADYTLDATRGATITFVDCYVGETLITADNVVELLGSSAANVTFANTK